MSNGKIAKKFKNIPLNAKLLINALYHVHSSFFETAHLTFVFSFKREFLLFEFEEIIFFVIVNF